MRTRRTLTVAMAVALTLAAGASHAAEPVAPVRPASRAEATKIVADLRRIVTANGVERLETVRIGGVDQWVSVRGADRRNPVLIMVHGGPGYTLMPLSWAFQKPWEDYFTVVQWDQRGAGKSYAGADLAALSPTMTVERMVADTEEVVAWARKAFGKDKVFLMGHSWGTIPGTLMAQRRPEWLHAYIGVGQASNGPEGERRGWRFAMERARADGNAEAIRDLDSIAPYAAPGRAVTREQVELQRKWLGYYGGAVHRRKDYSPEAAAIRLSPEYTDDDVRNMWIANDFSENLLLEAAIGIDFTGLREIGAPVFLFLGRDDYNVNAQASAEWLYRLKAPAKRVVWFEQSAHMPFMEEPGKFLVELVSVVRPLAEKAGDSPPK